MTSLRCDHCNGLYVEQQTTLSSVVSYICILCSATINIPISELFAWTCDHVVFYG